MSEQLEQRGIGEDQGRNLDRLRGENQRASRLLHGLFRSPIRQLREEG